MEDPWKFTAYSGMGLTLRNQKSDEISITVSFTDENVSRLLISPVRGFILC